MKFKYYLRGVGVGILVTVVLLMIAFAKYKPNLSADEIRKEAYKIGMIDEPSEEPEQSLDVTEREEPSMMPTDSMEPSQTPEPSKEPEASEKPSAEPEESDSTGNGEEEIVFVIKAGEYSDVISQHLEDLGLVKNAEKYNKWLMKKGYDSLIQPGEYVLKQGASYKEIAKIITAH